MATLPRRYLVPLSNGLICLFIGLLQASPGVAGERTRTCVPGLIPDVFVYSELLDEELDEAHHAVVVDKSRQELHVFIFEGRWRLKDTWPCSTGKKAGRKQKEGDSRTPEGIYYAVEHVPEQYLSETYGSYAMPLNYPNWIDRLEDRGGSAIWLHGTDKPLRERDSNGCVVLDNKHITALAAMVKLRQTPVIIVDELNWWRQQKADQWSANLMTLVERWQNDLMGSSYQKYKRWYAPGAGATMGWWHRWCRIRHARSRDIRSGKIRALNFDILKFGDTFTIAFSQRLEAQGARIAIGHRLLYVKNIAGIPRIIGDEQMSSLGDNPRKSTSDPLFAAWKKMKARTPGHKRMAFQRTADQES